MSKKRTNTRQGRSWPSTYHKLAFMMWYLWAGWRQQGPGAIANIHKYFAEHYGMGDKAKKTIIYWARHAQCKCGYHPWEEAKKKIENNQLPLPNIHEIAKELKRAGQHVPKLPGLNISPQGQDAEAVEYNADAQEPDNNFYGGLDQMMTLMVQEVIKYLKGEESMVDSGFTAQSFAKHAQNYALIRPDIMGVQLSAGVRQAHEQPALEEHETNPDGPAAQHIGETPTIEAIDDD